MCINKEELRFLYISFRSKQPAIAIPLPSGNRIRLIVWGYNDMRVISHYNDMMIRWHDNLPGDDMMGDSSTLSFHSMIIHVCLNLQRDHA